MLIISTYRWENRLKEGNSHKKILRRLFVCLITFVPEVSSYKTRMILLKSIWWEDLNGHSTILLTVSRNQLHVSLSLYSFLSQVGWRCPTHPSLAKKRSTLLEKGSSEAIVECALYRSSENAQQRCWKPRRGLSNMGCSNRTMSGEIIYKKCNKCSIFFSLCLYSVETHR
jgi:hypothetical protein